ncbi:MAG: InlB B-repeat-containing protein, partial [Clostridia bacterium]|nr:InlB B-repeat-containing protein [Clostridia bacterium]
ASAIEGGNTTDAGTADYMQKTGLVVITSDFWFEFVIGDAPTGWDDPATTTATYSVTFYSDAEGTTALETATDYSALEEGEEFNAPTETPELPENTTFGGWAAEKNSTSPVTWPQTMGDSDMEFFPIFVEETPSSYDVTYYEDEAGTKIFTSNTVANGESYTILTNGPTKTGHEFAGWTATMGSTETVSGSFEATANVSYYPVFTKNSYTVTFNANGGAFAENAVTSKSVPYGDAITADGISEPSRPGYTLLGWSKSASASAADNDLGTVPADNRTIIYAVWEVVEYRIAVYNEKGDATPVATLTVKYNDANPTLDTNLLTPPAGDDGDVATTVFAGWNYVADDSATGSAYMNSPLGTGVYTDTADTAVYATWIDSPSLKFMIPDLSDNEGWVDVYTHVKLTNGGANNVYDDSTFAAALVAATAKAAENGLSYTDNLNWYSDAELTAIAANQNGQTPEGELYAYADTGVTYLYIGESYKATVNLYANEGDETPFFTKEGQAGKNSDENERTFVVSKDALPEAPAGQYFAGWFDKEGNELVPATETSSAYTYSFTAGESDYFAKFEKFVFTVEFEINGNVVGSTEATYGDTINFAEVAAASNGTIPAIGDNADELYKPGYKFKGWSEASSSELLTDTFVVDNSKKIVADAMEDGSLTFTFYANADSGSYEARNDIEYTVETYRMNVSGVYEIESTEKLLGTTDSVVNADYTIDNGFALDSDLSVLSGTVVADGSLILSVYISRNEYTFTTIVNGQTTSNQYRFEEPVTEPEKPERTGYKFTGWDKKVPSIMPAENVTLNALFDPNVYNAVFNANGGQWSDGATEKTVETKYDSEIIAPEKPSKLGYDFVDWNTEVGVMDDVNGKNFTAQWVARTDTKYTVETYVMDASGEYVKSSQALTGKTDSTVTAEYTVDEHFAFNSELSVTSGVVAADGSLVLKVYIDRSKFTFTTVVDGVSTSTDYFYEEAIAELTPPVKTGYTFTGWDNAVPSTMPAENVTLNAIFEVNSYNAVFNANGGKWSDGNTEKTVATVYNTKIVAPENPTRTGYDFISWDSEVDTMDDVNGKTFTAQWAARNDTKYVVETYKMNVSGNYEAISTESFTGTTDSVASANYTVEDGFTVNSELSVLSGTILADGSLVLKVYIDRNKYTFTTVVDGETTAVEYFYEAEIVTPETPAKPGYKFNGWDNTIPEKMPASNVTVTANLELLLTMKLRDPSITTIKYGDSIVLHLDTSAALPDGWTVTWTADNNNFTQTVSDDGTTCICSPSKSGNTKFTVTVYDENGDVVGGGEQTLTSKAGFFYKIIAFFKKLFKLTKVYDQSLI